MNTNAHIIEKRYDGLVVDKCTVCGDASAMNESAVEVRQPNYKYFAKKHEKCGEIYAEQIALETAAVQDEATATAFRQLYAEASTLDETTGARTMKALAKAIDEIDLNPSIAFDGKVLTFTSRETRKKRTVTKFGCVQGFCDCENKISYHASLFAILERREQIKKYNAVEVLAVQSVKPQSKNGVVTELCGCRFNWSDKFYEVYCERHEMDYEIAMDRQRDHYLFA